MRRPSVEPTLLRHVLTRNYVTVNDVDFISNDLDIARCDIVENANQSQGKAVKVKTNLDGINHSDEEFSCGHDPDGFRMQNDVSEEYENNVDGGDDEEEEKEGEYEKKKGAYEQKEDACVQMENKQKKCDNEQKEGGYEQKEGGYEQEKGGSEQKEGGYEQKEGGYEQKKGGSEQKEDGYEQKEDGYEQKELVYEEKEDDCGLKKQRYEQKKGNGEQREEHFQYEKEESKHRKVNFGGNKNNSRDSVCFGLSEEKELSGCGHMKCLNDSSNCTTKNGNDDLTYTFSPFHDKELDYNETDKDAVLHDHGDEGKRKQQNQKTIDKTEIDEMDNHVMELIEHQSIIQNGGHHIQVKGSQIAYGNAEFVTCLADSDRPIKAQCCQELKKEVTDKVPVYEKCYASKYQQGTCHGSHHQSKQNTPDNNVSEYHVKQTLCENNVFLSKKISSTSIYYKTTISNATCRGKFNDMDQTVMFPDVIVDRNKSADTDISDIYDNSFKFTSTKTGNANDDSGTDQVDKISIHVPNTNVNDAIDGSVTSESKTRSKADDGSAKHCGSDVINKNSPVDINSNEINPVEKDNSMSDLLPDNSPINITEGHESSTVKCSELNCKTDQDKSPIKVAEDMNPCVPSVMINSPLTPPKTPYKDIKNSSNSSSFDPVIEEACPVSSIRVKPPVSHLNSPRLLGWAVLSPLSPKRPSSFPSFASPMSPLVGKELFPNGSHGHTAQEVRKLSRGRLSCNLNQFSSSPRPPARLIRRCDLKFEELIGKGAFGQVYKGDFLGRQVAIKIVYKRRGSGIHREILQAEKLAHSMNLRHANIVTVLGVNVSDGLRGDALIIMELVSTRTLQDTLDDVTAVISQRQRMNNALEIAQALRYLHSNDVAHLDVKPRNVLMTSEGTCKLADFGSLTRTRKDAPHEDTDFTQLLGTLPYRAPELMQGHFPSGKADIYSLGVTLWQLLTRNSPHDGILPHQLIYLVIKAKLRPTPLPEVGGDVMERKYRDLYTACWDVEPVSRPSAENVVEILKELLKTE